MKVGFHVEGQTDVTILKAFLARILNIQMDAIESVLLPSRKSYGHTTLLKTLPNACQYFWRENCELAIIGRDNDDHPVEHLSTHAQAADSDCHFCIYQSSIPVLPKRYTNSELKCVIVVPVQLIEAWLLLNDQQTPERLPRKQAKALFYGTEHLTSEIRTQALASKGLPFIQTVELDALAQRCPSFAFFRHQVT